MEPMKIDEVLDNARPDHQKFVIGPPPGYENEVGSLEMLVGHDPSLGGRVFRCYYELTDTERTAIAEGAPIEFSVFALQMVPVGAQVAFWHKEEAKEEHPVVGQDGPLDLRENGNGETSDS